ncbi:hypothetical protein B0O80DRAFT_533511 [Mortierella sp. GBAus27b]|nr:hypothetical protein B0O80DRAFT_533511 [Mortierella sp. GBAus27b]
MTMKALTARLLRRTTLRRRPSSSDPPLTITVTATATAMDLAEVLETIFSFLSQHTLRTSVCLVCRRWLHISRRFAYRRGTWKDQYLTTAFSSDPSAWIRELELFQSLDVSLQYDSWGATPKPKVTLDEEAALEALEQYQQQPNPGGGGIGAAAVPALATAATGGGGGGRGGGPRRHLQEILIHGNRQLIIEAHRPLLPYFRHVKILRLEFTMHTPLDLGPILRCCPALETLDLTPFEYYYVWREGPRPNILLFSDPPDGEGSGDGSQGEVGGAAGAGAAAAVGAGGTRSSSLSSSSRPSASASSPSPSPRQNLSLSSATRANKRRMRKGGGGGGRGGGGPGGLKLLQFQVRNAQASLETLFKVIDGAPDLRVFSFHTQEPAIISSAPPSQSYNHAPPILTNQQRQLLYEHISQSCPHIRHVRYSVPNTLLSMADIQSQTLLFSHLNEWVLNATDLTLGNEREDDELGSMFAVPSSSASTSRPAGLWFSAGSSSNNSSSQGNGHNNNDNNSNTINNNNTTTTMTTTRKQRRKRGQAAVAPAPPRRRRSFYKSPAMVRLRYLCYSINQLTSLEIQTRSNSTVTLADLDLAQALHFFLCSSPLLLHLKAPKVIFLTEYLNFKPHLVNDDEDKEQEHQPEPADAAAATGNLSHTIAATATATHSHSDIKRSSSWWSLERPIIDYWNLYSGDSHGDRDRHDDDDVVVAADDEEDDDDELQYDMHKDNAIPHEREPPIPSFSSSPSSTSSTPPQSSSSSSSSSFPTSKQRCRPIWACRGLQTLHLTFQSSVYDFSPTTRARMLYGYLSLVCPRLRDLSIRHSNLDLSLEGGMCMLARLRWLEKIRIQVDAAPEFTAKTKIQRSLSLNNKVDELAVWWLKPLIMKRKQLSQGTNSFNPSASLRSLSSLSSLSSSLSLAPLMWQLQSKVQKELKRWEEREGLTKSRTSMTTRMKMKMRTRVGSSSSRAAAVAAMEQDDASSNLFLSSESSVEPEAEVYKHYSYGGARDHHGEMIIIEELGHVQESRRLLKFTKDVLVKGNTPHGPIPLPVVGNTQDHPEEDDCVWPRLESLELVFSEDNRRRWFKYAKAVEELQRTLKRLRPGVRINLRNLRFIDWKYE